MKRRIPLFARNPFIFALVVAISIIIPTVIAFLTYEPREWHDPRVENAIEHINLETRLKWGLPNVSFLK